jgi:hypothetical protein
LIVLFGCTNVLGSRPMATHFLYRRRDFFTLLSGAAAGWPLTARAQRGERMRRIGVLITTSDEPDWQARNHGAGTR